MRLIRNLAVAFAPVVAVLGLALGSAGAASAAPAAPAVILPVDHVVSAGTNGYEALLGGSLSSLGATITTYGPALNVGTIGAGGLGEQACDPNANALGQTYRIDLGEVAIAGSSFNVDYANGFLGSGGLACENAGTFPAAQAHTLDSNLTGLGVGDTVSVWMSHWDKTFCKPIPDADHDACVTIEVGRVHLQAFDWTTAAGPFDKYITVPADLNLHSAGAGVQQNPALVSACSPLDIGGGDATVDGTPVNPGVLAEDTVAVGSPGEESGYTNPTGPAGSGACNLVASFSNVSVDPASIFSLGTPFSTPFNPVVQVVSTASGIRANPALAATDNTLLPGGFDFESFAGNPAGL